jgi:hypothetical protein
MSNQTAINTNSDKPAKRTSNATFAAQMQAANRRQQQRDQMIAATLAFCPEFLDGEPLNRIRVGL